MLSEAGTVKSRGVVVKHAGLWSLRRRFESARDYSCSLASSLSSSLASCQLLAHEPLNIFKWREQNHCVGCAMTAIIVLRYTLVMKKNWKQLKGGLKIALLAKTHCEYNELGER